MRLSIVIPFFNEQDFVQPLMKALTSVLDDLYPECEVICVDDGSTDRTVEHLLAAQDEDFRIQIITLSRHFGKEAAQTAGLDRASGDAVLFMDADLQHPPELIPEFLAKLSEGWDVVHGVRNARKGEAPLPRNTGDFRILSRRAADAVRALPERDRFMTGLFAWVGFRQTALRFEGLPRASRISSLSLFRPLPPGPRPLRAWIITGSAIASTAALYAAWIVGDAAVTGAALPGNPTIAAALFFLGGVQVLSIGALGEYGARIVAEMKQRPLYLVQDTFKSARKQDPSGRVVRLDLVKK